MVEEVGEGVTGFVPGDQVYGMTGGVGDLQGLLAEYAAVDARLLGVLTTSVVDRCRVCSKAKTSGVVELSRTAPHGGLRVPR
jgi:hypothetical protein